MKTVILDRATLGDDLDIKLPFDTEVVSFERISDEELTEGIKDADVIFVNKIKLSESVLSKARKLKLICEAATGYDNIDIKYCKKRGIAVCNVPGYSTFSVSQITVAMVMYLVNHMPEYTRYTSSGEYTESGIQNCLKPVFHELNRMTWGIVGYGNIGTRVATAARAFGCKVLAFKRTPCEGVECADIDTVMKKSDIITVHLPLTDDTRNLINRERIAMMKPDAVFVNVARGAVVDEEALCEAVEAKKIGAVGIDVYSVEPFSKESPYYRIKDMDNVCLTPHVAWGAYEARARCVAEMIENMRSFLNGKTRNRVDL